MGQADVNVNLWLKDTKRFADLFNAILFQGKAVILPENLYPSPNRSERPHRGSGRCHGNSKPLFHDGPVA